MVANALSDIHQRDGDVHRGGRLTGAALLVAQNNDVGRCLTSRVRLRNMTRPHTGQSP